MRSVGLALSEGQSGCFPIKTKRFAKFVCACAGFLDSASNTIVTRAHTRAPLRCVDVETLFSDEILQILVATSLMMFNVLSPSAQTDAWTAQQIESADLARHLAGWSDVEKDVALIKSMAGSGYFADMNICLMNAVPSQEPTQFAGGVLGALLILTLLGIFQLLRWGYVKLTQTRILNEEEKEAHLVRRFTLSKSQLKELLEHLTMCNGEFKGFNLDHLCASEESIPLVIRPHKKTDQWEVFLVFERRWEQGRIWKSKKWERLVYGVFRISDEDLSLVYHGEPESLNLRGLAEDIFSQKPEVVTDKD